MSLTLEHLKNARTNIHVFTMKGELGGLSVKANIHGVNVPDNHITFDVEGFSTGAIISYRDLAKMKTTKQLENYVKRMLLFGKII